jgi:excisionase family DNA binding protein
MRENSTLDPLLTVPQVAAYLGWSPATVYSLANKRRIPYVKVGRSLRFRRADIERLLIVHPSLDAEVWP